MTDNGHAKYGMTTIVILLILTFLAITGLRYLFIQLHLLPQPCTVEDVYDIGPWSACTREGYQFTTVTKRDHITCTDPGSVERPDAQQSCVYTPPCTAEDLETSNWSICSATASGVYVQTRQVRIKAGGSCIETPDNRELFAAQRSCAPELSKKVTILSDYLVLVDPTNVAQPYAENMRNVTMSFQGQFKKMLLHVTAETSFRIPEYYYFRFALSNDFPRTLGTSRIADNRLDTKAEGIFQGTESPATRHFNLETVRAAAVGGQGLGASVPNYLGMINSRNADRIDLTLYVGDGQSMITPDPKNRIFVTIKEAVLEFECQDSSQCSATAL